MPEDCYNPVCEKSEPQSLYRKLTPDNLFPEEDMFDEEEPKKIPDAYRDCPISRDALGYYTWNFLHTMAAYYPDHPSEREKSLMTNFFEGFSEFYPCKPCQKDLKRELK